MDELVIAIREYAAWLYGLLLVLAVRELLAIRRAGKDRRRAMFLLEREAANSRAVRSLIVLLLLFTLATGVYTVAELVAPALPDRPPAELGVPVAPLPTPVLPAEMPIPSRLPTEIPIATRLPSPRLPLIVTATPLPTTSPMRGAP